MVARLGRFRSRVLSQFTDTLRELNLAAELIDPIVMCLFANVIDLRNPRSQIVLEVVQRHFGNFLAQIAHDDDHGRGHSLGVGIRCHHTAARHHRCAHRDIEHPCEPLGG